MEEDVPGHFKEVVRGSFWNLTGNIFFKAVSFFYYILVAHAVSQGELDLFFLALGIITLFDPLDDFGLAPSLSRFIPFMEGRGEKGRVKELVFAGYAVSLASSFIMMGIVYFQADLIASIYRNAHLAAALQTLCIMLVLSNLGKITSAFQQSQKDIKGMQALSNAQNLLKLVITLVMFDIYGPTLFSLATGALGSTAISLALISPIIIRRIAALPGHLFAGKASIPLFREVLSFGLALTAVNVVGAFLFSTDIALLGYFSAATTGAIAIYFVAFSLSIALTVLPFSMDTIFSPLMANFHGKKEMGKMAETLDAATRWSFLIMIPPAIVFLTIPEYLLSTIFGESYVGGASALSLMVVGVVVSVLHHPISLALSSMRMIGRIMKVYIPGGVMFALLTFILTPSIGILGPCVAGLAANVFMLFAYRKEIGSVLPMKPLGGLLKMALGGIFVLAIMLVSKPFLLSLAQLLPSFSGMGDAQLYLDKALLLAFLIVPTAMALSLFSVALLLLRCLSADDVSIFKRALLKMRIPEPLSSWLMQLASHGTKV